MAQDRILLQSCRIKNQLLKEFLAEMVGTFILVLVCDCSIAVQVLSKPHKIDILAIGFATGMALMLCFYGASRLSGGHVNPVVTLSLVALGHLPFWKIFHYFAGQYIGGFLATAVAYSNHYSAITVFDGGVRSAFFNSTSTAGILTSHPAHHLPLSGAVIDQVICCALLMLGILCIVDHRNLNTPKPLIPIGLFILLAGLICAFGLNCGPALNPARDIPARIFAWMVGYGSEVWAPHSHLYWLVGGLIAPHLGGILGTWIYHLGLGLHLADEQLYVSPILASIDCMSISTDLAKLAICHSATNHISIYDLSTNELRDKFALKSADKQSGRQTFQVTGMDFSPDGERLAIGQSDSVIFVYKIGAQWAQKKFIVNKYTLHSPVCKLYWLAHGIIFASIDGRVKWIQTQSQKMSSLINVPQSVCVSMSYSQDQIIAGFLNGQIWTNWLGATGGTQGATSVVRESTSQLLLTISTPPFALALTSTGYICASGSDGRIVFQQVASTAVSGSSSASSTKSLKSTASTTNRQTIEYGQDVSMVVSSPSGTVLIASSRQSLLVFELDSRIWKHKLTVDMNGSLLITGLCWSSDGTRLAASTINQAVLLFRCQWQSKLIGNRFEINYVGNRQLVIKDLQASNQSAMFSSNFDVQEVKIIKESFVVIWTTNTLIMGSLSNPAQRSEIEWTGLTTRGVRFSFDYENIVLISAVGELYLIQLGHNAIMGSVRTDFISPHLISVRMNERKSSSKVFAYLLDAKTIAVVDLITGLKLNTWSHQERIDWIELNETGHRMIYRDKALKLVLLLNVVQQDLVVLLNSGCGFVQWVPGSDVIVAQCRDKLYVWYDYDKPIIHPIIGGELNEAFEIERSNGVTKVRFTQPNTDIVLDEVLLEFDTAIDDGDLTRAEQFLESLDESSVTDRNSMWLTLGNLALKYLNLSVAERSFAAIGDLAKVNFIQQCQRDSSMLALLDSDWDRFESGQFDRVLETYLNTYNWDRAIKFVNKFGRQDLQDELQQKYYQWLLDTGQHSIAAQILERDGKIDQAIGLYLKSGRLGQLTKLIVNNSSNESIGKELIQSVIGDLERAEAYEEAGDLYQLPVINNNNLALQSYTKAKAFAKAINMARVHYPDQVVSLENQYGEYLMNEMDDSANAVNHFIEAGRTERALEAAVQARQFDRAAEIASILDTVPQHLGKKIAEHYVTRNEIEPALEMYLNMACIREAVQLLNDRGQYARAYKIAKQLMSADEAREMYEMIAKSYETEGKWKEAERIYIACGDVDSAISMYKNQRQFESMVRLVRQYHPTLLNETCIYLARELESDRMYKQAEQYYLMASEWQQAAMMYRNAALWEDAYRVSRANGGATAAKQVAFHWAQTMATPQDSVSLLNRFGLLNQVVDYSLEANEFEFALLLIRNSPDLKHKLIDVRLKYAVWLENEGHYNEAETMYVQAGKPKEAVVMYLHRNNFEDALRVAEQHADDDEVVKDILTAQARFLFEQMKRTEHFDRLDRVEGLLLRAGRIEVAVRLFRDNGLMEDAVRIAEQYAPHLLDSLRRDLINLQSGSYPQSEIPTPVQTESVSIDHHHQLSQMDLTQALKTAEQNGDKESIVRYSMLLSGELLKEHQAYESLGILAKHSSSTFILPDSKKLLSRITVVMLSMDEPIEGPWSPNHNSEVYSLLRDSLHQLLVENSSLNSLERELFQKYLLISHYLTLKSVLQRIMDNNGDSPAIGSVRELHLKLTISLLRYTDVVRADKAFLEAGLACRRANRIEMAFVFLNHFLDLLDAIEEQNFNVDHSDFAQTDIPFEVPLPTKIMFDEQTVDDIKGWVLQTSMDAEISQTLPMDPLRDGQVYEASLLNADGTRAMACLVTGYPVVGKHKMIEFQPGKYVANKEDWNKLLMIAKILDDGQLRQVLQFIGTLCGNANIVKFSFQ